MEAALSSCHITTQRCNTKAATWIFVAVKASTVASHCCATRLSDKELYESEAKTAPCKVVPVFNKIPRHEDVLGSEDIISPHILILGTRRRWFISFTPWPLYSQGKNPRYPLDSRLGGPQSQFGRGGEEKNTFIAPAGNSTP